MGSIGWHNPFPLELGGGPTAAELVFESIRSLLGRGGSAESDTGIDGLYREVRARAFGLVGTFGERAVLQAFPNLATDALGYYEELLAIAPDPSKGDAERREDVAVGYTRQILSALPDVATALAAIDARFSLVDVPHENADVTQPGRAFEDLAAAQPYGGGRKSTALPNYSNEFRLHVLFAIGAGVSPSLEEQRLIRLAAGVLHEVLPAWNDFAVYTDFDGFDLDVDLLDLTALT